MSTDFAFQGPRQMTSLLLSLNQINCSQIVQIDEFWLGQALFPAIANRFLWIIPLISLSLLFCFALMKIMSSENQEIDTLDSLDYFTLLDGSVISFLTCDSLDGPVVSKDSKEHFDLTGLFVWAGGKLMALYMQKNPQLFTGKRVVELGAGGSGLLAVLGVRIGVKAWIATDWGSDTVLERLSENIARNGVDSTAKAAPYRWGDHSLTSILASNSAIEAHVGFSTAIPHLLNLLVAADVIYPSMSSIQICDLLTSFKVLHKSPETSINEFYCSYIHRDYSGETLKRVLNAVLEVEGLMVDVVDFEDDEAKRQGGSIFRFWFGSELDTRQKMVQVVGERVMPSIWEKKEQIAEEWSFPFHTSESDEDDY